MGTTMAGQRQVKAGVLGATGTVGQRFIVLLSQHPYFVVHALGASSRSAGKAYKDATRWKQTVPIPEAVRAMTVTTCDKEHFADCDVVFSGLDSDVAGDVEDAFRKAELAVFSNAKNYRQDPLCPLIVPLVNPSHLGIIEHQRKTVGTQKGFIVTNANCAITGLSVALHALEQRFGPLDAVIVTTMQAISGAGYPGVASLDIFDNVVPYISGEEDKVENELNKILAPLSEDSTAFLKRGEGSPESPKLRVSVRFARQPAPSPAEAAQCLQEFTCEAQSLGCPSAPRQAITVHEEQDRPQPKLDRYFQDGAGVSVGRIRECPVMDIKFVLLANNVSIGAATSSLINAEIAVAQGLI